MHPAISEFPRKIFYGGYLKDGPNVISREYGNPLKTSLLSKFPTFKVSDAIHVFTESCLTSDPTCALNSLSRFLTSILLRNEVERVYQIPRKLISHYIFIEL